ncbi:Pr6Pr family membrane protein [Leucobacter salsicius]|uniref:Pr6Pr family membrane protein n=1 Tax=Leucobacter salsicius TaxID=664638 RepID=UPI00034561C0|nr:Pr6Pr family membrane protein [Leucobacter salsicius]
MMSTPRFAIAWIRIAIGSAAIAVVGYAYLDGLAAGNSSPFDFFGYFTNQTSLGTGAILIATGVTTLRGQPVAWLSYARSVSVACMLIVSAIYNGIVPGTGSAPAWVSIALHIGLPLFVAADWVLVADRPTLPWRTIWLSYFRIPSFGSRWF